MKSFFEFRSEPSAILPGTDGHERLIESLNPKFLQSVNALYGSAESLAACFQISISSNLTASSYADYRKLKIDNSEIKVAGK
jgi:hypothetical protein